MDWTWENVVVAGIGVVSVVGWGFAFRHRAAYRRLIIRQQRAMFGSWFAQLTEKKTTPMSAVGVPAIGGMIIGVVFILDGIFGHPSFS